MGKKVLITSRSFGKLSPEPMRILQEAGFQADTMVTDFDMDRFVTALPRYDALIIGAHTLPEDLLDRCPKLRIICKHGVGLDNIPVEKARACDIVVTNTPGTNSEAVADLTFGLMLDTARKITRSAEHVREGVPRQDIGVDVYGKTLGLIGFGRIAQAVARRAIGFQMQILAFDPYIKDCPGGLEKICLADKHRVLRDSDFVSIHLPLTEETRNFIGTAELDEMKSDAHLNNTARGGVINEDALYDALVNGKIGSAALDVTKEEPTSPDNRLLSLENVVITSHIGMYSREAITAVSLLCAKAVSDLFSGKSPQNIVTPSPCANAGKVVSHTP